MAANKQIIESVTPSPANNWQLSTLPESWDIIGFKNIYTRFKINHLTSHVFKNRADLIVFKINFLSESHNALDFTIYMLNKYKICGFDLLDNFQLIFLTAIFSIFIQECRVFINLTIRLFTIEIDQTLKTVGNSSRQAD